MKFKTSSKLALVCLASLAAVSSVQAQTMPMPANPPSAGTGTQMSEMTNGEVRKIDKENKKITLKHAEIKNLGMPGGMTMVFQMKDPAMLDKVKEGDKVMFKAEKLNGAMTVTDIEPAK